jgi:MFS family permease
MDPTPGTSRIPRPVAFWGVAAILSLLLFASSAPSPLYVVYQAEWDFSAITLTSVFAIYALALLATLLTAGSVSDHIGRKPTLIVALILEIVAMVGFAEAQDVVWLFAARALQGVATGIAMGTITAALLDLQPPTDERLGAVVGVAAPMSGLATGALATGLLVQYGPDPTHLVYWLLVGMFALAIPFAAAIPETVRGDGRWVRSLRPRIAVPSELRVAFIATIPCMVACWALGGLVLSLGPSLTVSVLGNDSHLAAGLPIFIMAGISAIASVRLRESHARATAQGGLAALIAGVVVVLAALALSSTALFLVGSAVAGLGFGPAFSGAFRALSTQAPPEQRGSFVSAILTVAYLAFSLPAVAAGAAVTQIGLEETAMVYGVALLVLAGLALVLSRQLQDPQSAVPQPA